MALPYSSHATLSVSRIHRSIASDTRRDLPIPGCAHDLDHAPRAARGRAPPGAGAPRAPTPGRRREGRRRPLQRSTSWRGAPTTKATTGSDLPLTLNGGTASVSNGLRARWRARVWVASTWHGAGVAHDASGQVHGVAGDREDATVRRVRSRGRRRTPFRRSRPTRKPDRRASGVDGDDLVHARAARARRRCREAVGPRRGG